jgi:serine protease inhibitor ecotin
VNRFITLDSEPYLICYNNRVPIVVYPSEGVEARYQVWITVVETRVVEKD